MERSEAPWSVVNPGPSPWENINPAAIGIRNRAGNYRQGDPDRAIGRNCLPIAVVIEIFVADYIARDILRRQGFIQAAITYLSPVVKAIHGWRYKGLMNKRSSAT